MDNFVILAIILFVILVTIIILKVLHNNDDDTFDTLLQRRTEKKRDEEHDLNDFLEPLRDTSEKTKIKSSDDLSREYSDNLRKLEEERSRKELYKLYWDKVLGSDITEKTENKDNVHKVDITKYKYNIKDLGYKNYNKEKTSHTGYWKKTGISKYRWVSDNDFNENSEYNELLKTMEWKRRREDVFIARGRKCMYCGNRDNLDIHHKYYLKYPDGEFIKPWEYNMDCYMVLCRDCHNKVHEKYQIKSYYIRRS